VARLATAATIAYTVENEGLKDRGVAAEDVTISYPAAGHETASATGPGMRH
jgi:hypothetical protein